MRLRATALLLIMTASSQQTRALEASLARAYGRAIGQGSGIEGATARPAGSEVLVTVHRSLPDVEANTKRQQALHYRLAPDGALRRAAPATEAPPDVAGAAPRGPILCYVRQDARSPTLQK